MAVLRLFDGDVSMATWPYGHMSTPPDQKKNDFAVPDAPARVRGKRTSTGSFRLTRPKRVTYEDSDDSATTDRTDASKHPGECLRIQFVDGLPNSVYYRVTAWCESNGLCAVPRRLFKGHTSSILSMRGDCYFCRDSHFKQDWVLIFTPNYKTVRVRCHAKGRFHDVPVDFCEDILVLHW